MGIGLAVLDPSPKSSTYPRAPLAWVSETLSSNSTGAPRSARHGLTVSVTLSPPKLVVDVRSPRAGPAAGPGGGEAARALEAVTTLITTKAATANAHTTGRRGLLGVLRRGPTPSGYRSSTTSTGPSSRQDIRIIFVALLPPRAVTTNPSPAWHSGGDGRATTRVQG